MSEGGEPVRGFEFLADVERSIGGIDADEGVVEKDDNETVVEGFGVATESEVEADTTFTSNFLALRH